MSDNPIPEPTNATPATTGTAPGQQAGDQKPPEKTFTQADLNAIIQDRLQKHEESILKKIGVSTLDDAKKAALRLREIEDAQKSEAEKLTERITETEYRAMQIEERYRTTQIENAALKELGGQVDPAKLKAALKLLDTSKLTISDDGTVVGTADAVKALLEENPFLKPEQTPGKPKAPSIGATNPAGTSTAPNLNWYKGANPNNVTLGGGGVRSPSGE